MYLRIKWTRCLRSTFLVVSVVAITAVTAFIFEVGPAAAASTSLTGDAESGDLSAWAATSNASVLTTAAYHGSYGYQLDASLSAAYLNWNSTQIEQNHPWASVSMWFKINSHGATTSTDLMSLKSVAGVHNFDFFLLPNEHLQWDLLSTDNAQSTYALTPNTWHLVEVRVYYGGTTYTAQVQIDGVDQGSIASTGQSATDVKSLYIGTNLATKTYSTDIDDVKVQVGDSDLGYNGNSPSSAYNATGCSG